MNEKMEILEELFGVIFEEAGACAEKLRTSGGKLAPGDAEYIDILAHAIKSLKTTMAMMESEASRAPREETASRSMYEGSYRNRRYNREYQY